MYTFGGLYDGSGDKTSINNWIDNPALVANYVGDDSSNDPRREAHRMYTHVQTRSNNCLAVPEGGGGGGPSLPPTTPHPTSSPTSPPPGFATYDSSLGAPRCSSISSFCDTGSLVNGRGSLNGGVESNSASNTLGTCNDGSSGSYHSDESIDKIKVSVVGGGNLQEGAVVEIDATVYAWSATADTADIYYATNANSPTWTLVGSYKPGGTGLQSIKAQVTLGTGALQAVRVNFRYNGGTSTCSGGSYDDTDDIVFGVEAVVATTTSTTIATTNTPPATTTTTTTTTTQATTPVRSLHTMFHLNKLYYVFETNFCSFSSVDHNYRSHNYRSHNYRSHNYRSHNPSNYSGHNNNNHYYRSDSTT
jgi:hypothetical protein